MRILTCQRSQQRRRSGPPGKAHGGHPGSSIVRAGHAPAIHESWHERTTGRRNGEPVRFNHELLEKLSAYNWPTVISVTSVFVAIRLDSPNPGTR